MQARSRRASVCLFCALTTRPRAPLPAAAASLHSSAVLWRLDGHRRSRPAANSSGAPRRGNPGRPSLNSPRRVPPSRDDASPAFVRLKTYEILEEKRDVATTLPLLDTMDVDGKQRDKLWSRFEAKVRSALAPQRISNSQDRADAVLGFDDVEDGELAELWINLQRQWKERGIKGLERHIEHSWLGFVAASKSFSKDDYQNQKALADLRYPTEWYPATRKMQRKIIMHVGPTNSGKTYHALKRLEEAESGAYAGPLRLLAHEVYTRMNAKDISCALVTGEERRSPYAGEKPRLIACTVEMIPLHMNMEVCVIDEIQLIGDIERGWAWTQALLGVQAKEIHLCGEERSVPLIRELASSMGDDFEVKTYERLTPLEFEDQHVGKDFRKLRKGDCIVAFSVVDIHQYRQQIQQQTGKKVAIVYGSLPPETRAQQARLFNDPNSGYDVLVASDAIGMGLNLSIKRVIFASTQRFNGIELLPLSIPHLKQIAGRAGRYKTAHEANEEAKRPQSDAATAIQAPEMADIPVETLADVAAEEPSPAGHAENAPFEFAEPPPGGGLVTTLSRRDLAYAKKALQAQPEPIRTAGLFPPDPIVERFANYFPPGTPFSYILLRLHEISRVHTRFHMCILKDQLSIADAIHPIEGLTITDRITFAAGPANIKSYDDKRLVCNLAKCVAEQKNGNLLDIEGFKWELLDRPIAADRQFLRELETLHKAIVLYLWLSYRFSGVFSTRALAFHTKMLVEEAIEATLTEFSRTRQGTPITEVKHAPIDRLYAPVRRLKLEQFRDDFLEAERAGSRGVGKTHTQHGIREGSRYEQADVLDGAEEGDEVEPVDVRKGAASEGEVDDDTKLPLLELNAAEKTAQSRDMQKAESPLDVHVQNPILDSPNVDDNAEAGREKDTNTKAAHGS